MNFEETSLKPFTVVGISVRTTNKDGQSQKDIGELFNKFFSEQIATLIPHKVSEDIYCIYTDYENDFTGEYTALLGCKVSEASNLPDGLVVRYIPECKYRKYQAQGEVHEVVGHIWAHIWQSTDIDRAYVADFDVYGPEARNPQDALITTFLSVKS